MTRPTISPGNSCSAPKIDSALGYAELGYPVFPCRANSKIPRTPDGFKSASTLRSRVETWWTEHEHDNIAIATEGLIVLDIDPGATWLADEPDKWRELQDRGVLATTPRGGKHYWFAAPEGQSFRSTTGLLAPHVDTRSSGGYALVAPSVIDGKPYQWVDGELPNRVKLKTPPGWLLEALLGSGRGGISTSFRSDTPVDANPIPEGQRNSTLFRLGGAMRRYGFSERAIHAALTVEGEDRCDPPLPGEEVRQISRQAACYEPDQVATAVVEDHFGQLVEAGVLSKEGLSCTADEPQCRAGRRCSPDEDVTFTITSFANIEEEKINYLWRDMVAIGKLTVISGDPGVGKSYLACDMAARVSRGVAFPGDEGATDFEPIKGSALILTHEDGLADTIKPRLRACGADFSKVYAVDEATLWNHKTDESTNVWIDLGTMLSDLRAEIERLDNIRLLIIDPITAYLGNKDSNNNVEVRSVLTPLGNLAKELSIAIVAISHLKKGGGDGPMVGRTLGSVAFTAVSRTALSVTFDREDPERNRRLVMPAKNNSGKHNHGWAYRLEDFDDPGAVNHVPRVVFDPDPVQGTADTIGATNNRDKPPTAKDSARDFLLGELGSGPCLATRIQRTAALNNHKRATLSIAMNEIGGKVRLDGVSVWALPKHLSEDNRTLTAEGEELFRSREAATERDNDLAGWTESEGGRGGEGTSKALPTPI